MTRPSKLSLDLVFNYAALGVTAASGLATTYVVVRSLGEAALGLFNQAFALYIAASQLAVGGVHHSVLRSVARAGGDDGERARIVSSGVALAAGLGSAAGLALFASRGAWARLFNSPAMAPALVYVAPSLVLFAVNKTLLAALNGLERMRAFALLQALRTGVLLATLSAVAGLARPAPELLAGLLTAELAVLLAAVLALRTSVALGPRRVARAWLERHLRFGAQGFLSGVFLELNTRVDVLAIGFFLSDTEVGRYSVAAVLAEGLYQCLIVVKNQMNPALAKMLVEGDSAAISRLVHRAWRYLYPGMALAYGAGLLIFQWALGHVLELGDGADALGCYAILGAGVLTVAGFVPFDGILLQAGRPGLYTLFTSSIALSNLALNIALIPSFGIRGAALATATALVLSIASLALIMRSQLGFTYLNVKPRLG